MASCSARIRAAMSSRRAPDQAATRSSERPKPGRRHPAPRRRRRRCVDAARRGAHIGRGFGGGVRILAPGLYGGTAAGDRMIQLVRAEGARRLQLCARRSGHRDQRDRADQMHRHHDRRDQHPLFGAGQGRHRQARGGVPRKTGIDHGDARRRNRTPDPRGLSRRPRRDQGFGRRRRPLFCDRGLRRPFAARAGCSSTRWSMAR